jgi:hypothetical protein
VSTATDADANASLPDHTWTLPRSPATRDLRRVAVAVIALHFGLLAAHQWLIFDAMRFRTVADLQSGIAAGVMAHGIRLAVTESLTLLIAGLAAAGLLASRRYRDTSRVLTVFAISYIPIALYSAGVAVAFLSGWELDVWALSAPGASQAEIAATIEEAMPVVLQPLAAGRHVANAGAILLFAVLQRRFSGTTVRRSVAAAVAAGVVLTLSSLLA